MASTTMVSGCNAALIATPAMECRSASSAAFGSVRFAPMVKRSGAVKVNASVRASATEEPKAVRQAMIGLLAAGAILVSGVPAFALTGPGGDGAATTAKEADILLNKADKLTKNDSPKRFGDGLKNAGSTAQQAGSSAASNVEDVADAAVKSARDNLNKAKASFGDLMGKGSSKTKGKISDASSTTNQAFQLGDASDVISDAKSNAANAVDDAKSALSGLGDKLTGSNPGNVAADVQSKAGNAISDAKANLPNVSLPEKKAGQNF